MAIDPRIALGVNPPPQQGGSPLENISKIVGIKQLLTEAPLRAKALQQENDIRQRDIDENNAIKEALSATGNDVEKALPAILQASPTKGAVIQKNFYDTAKARQELTTSKLDHDIKQTGFTSQVLSGVKNADDYAGALATLHASGVDTSQMSPFYSPAAVDAYIKKGKTLQLQFDEAKARFEQDTKTKELGFKEQELGFKSEEEKRANELQPSAVKKANADATLAEAKANLAKLTPEDWEKQVATLVNPKTDSGLYEATTARVRFAAKSGNAEAAQKALDDAAGELKTIREETSPRMIAGRAASAAAVARAVSPITTQTAVNTEVAKQRINAAGTLATLGPAQKAIAQKLADGDFNPAELSRFPDKEALTAAAIELNPDWTRQTYATKKAFTDPASRQSQNLGTVSRIVEHIDRFTKNSDDLGVSPSMLTGRNLSGKAAKVHEDAHAISSELEKLVSGGVGTQSQVKSWQNALTSTVPSIRKEAIEEISNLVGGQFIGMNQTYKAGTGKDLPLDKFTSKDSREWLKRNGIDVSGGETPAADAVPTITDQKVYDALPVGSVYIDGGSGKKKTKTKK